MIVESLRIKTHRVFLAFFAFIAVVACGDLAKEVSSELGVGMDFSGTVLTTGGDAIEGATVRFIALLDLDAITKLVEYRKVDDGNGGKKDLIRIKLDKVHGFAPTAEVTTDKFGKFTKSLPLQAYLVYVYGPGPAPGSAGAYSVAFWGINPETGELDLDHLIGADGSLKPTNNSLSLSGGAQPEAAPPAAAPLASPPNPTTAVTAVPAEPTAADTKRPEETPAPTSDDAFWTDISLPYEGGTLGTSSGTYTISKAPPPSGVRYLTLSATLASAQSEPVYVVLQSGFDSNYTKDCTAAKASAKTYVYPTVPNGKTITYKFVPPSKYYKVFLAKTATKADDGKVTSTNSSKTLIVGDRSCENALPDRRFITTLTWSTYGDLALHAYKYDKAKLTSDPENALVDEANWTRQKGVTLQHDVDNVVGFGPENITEDSSVADVSNYCYKVKVQYYAGSGEINATVDTTMVVKENGVDVVKKYSATHKFTTPGTEWWPVGIYPDTCPSEKDAVAGRIKSTDSASIEGYYNDPKWGDMAIKFEGTTFKAAYAYRKGTVTGTWDEATNTIKGWWCEEDRSANNGDVEFIFEKKGTSAIAMDGKYRFGSSGGWNQDWDLTKVEGAAPADLIARFEDASAFCTKP